MIKQGDQLLLGGFSFRVNRIRGDFATLTWLRSGVTHFKIVRIKNIVAVIKKIG